MPYVIDFSIISFIYLFITATFYFKQNKVNNTRNKYFSILLILCLMTLVLDVIVVLLNKTKTPVFLTYLLNIIFLLCIQINGPILLGYISIITGILPKIKKWQKYIALIPFCVAALLIIISPITDIGVFKIIAENNEYISGKHHFVIYVSMGIYLFIIFIISIVKFGKMQNKKEIAIISFLLVTVISMIIQYNYPYLLVTCMGNALALSIMYHTLQEPDEHIDSLTKLLNGNAINYIMSNLYEQNERFTIRIFAIKDVHTINQEYGVKYGDYLMIEITNYLKKFYTKDNIVRISGDIFGVINFTKEEKLNDELLIELANKTPKKWNVLDHSINTKMSFIGINSVDFVNETEIDNILQYIIYKHRKNENNEILLVNKEYIKEREYYKSVQTILEQAIKEKTIMVYYQPIHNVDGKLVGLEALCRLYDEKTGFISPDLFIDIAEKNGLIFELGEIILENVCKFIKEYNVKEWNLHHIGVNLSFLQCTSENIYFNFKKILNKYEVLSNQISFEITETATSSGIEIVNENMNKFINDGYTFMLDDFGSGYANYNYVVELPFICIKIDKYILWKAMENKKDMIYLKTLVKALKKLDLLILCEGVETKEQVELLKDIGVDMLQGFIYSKALSDIDIYEYAKKNKLVK